MARHLLLPLMIFGLLVVGNANADRPPNIVFIMADDIGLGDVGFHHRERTGKAPIVPTPHLDAIAAAGMRFSDAHSSTALCSPTRYCAMSGNLNYRSYAPWGVWGTFRPSPFTDKDATLGRVARRGGLQTGFVGKWHLGGDYRRKDSDKPYRGGESTRAVQAVNLNEIVSGGPQSVGFDYSFTLPCGIQGPVYTAYENGKWSPFSAGSELIYLSEETAADPAYVSDKGPGMGDSNWDPKRVGPMLAGKATGFIKRNAESGKPFFLCYWPSAVHKPHVPPKEFDGKPVAGQTPTAHLDMVIDLDQQVGRIMNALKESGVAENTLLVFSSDNGGLYDKGGLRAGHDSSGGYRGFKNVAYEGGHRVPMLAVWPGKIAAGSQSDEPVAVHDLVATMATLLGVQLRPDQAQDSFDLSPLLLGSPNFQGRTELLLQGGSRHEAIYRRGDWKLILQSNHQASKWEPIGLFNLADTPREPDSGNLVKAPAQQDRVAEMRARYLALRASGDRTTPLPAIEP